MSFKIIKELLYDIAETMTVANGYNYDWTTSRRTDLYNKSEAVFSVEYPDGAPFELNVDELGGINSFQYRNRRNLLFVAKIKSDLTVVIADEVIDKNNDALDKALDDYTKAFCGTISQALCEQGVRIITFNGAVKRATTTGNVYYPYELVVEYDLDYIKTRC